MGAKEFWDGSLHRTNMASIERLPQNVPKETEMQNSYTIETIARLTQQDRLAEAQSDRLAQVARGSSRRGFLASVAEAIRSPLSRSNDEYDLAFVPKLADYPSTH